MKEVNLNFYLCLGMLIAEGYVSLYFLVLFLQGNLMINENQIPQQYLNVINREYENFKTRTTVEIRNKIPNTKDIPISNPNHWFKIPDVICVFVDMKGSTKLSASIYDKSTAGIYQFFTGTAVRMFHEFGTSYIDVKGDGVFALFNKGESYKAIAAAITFKTFVSEVFIPEIEKRTGIEIGLHVGIDQKTVLVSKVGIKRTDERTDRQNEVWAGKPVNMASKLASLTNDNEILVSDRFFRGIKNDLVLYSCGCPDGEKSYLWKKVDVSDDEKFDFNTAYKLGSIWCSVHGKEYCKKISLLDK